MKSRNYCILALSLYSFMITMIVGMAQIHGVLRTDYLGIMMITVTVMQVIIMFIAVGTGYERKNKQ